MSDLLVALRDEVSAAQTRGETDAAKALESAGRLAVDALNDKDVRNPKEVLKISFAHFRDSSQTEEEYNAWANAIDVVIRNS
jgi:predicted metal-dependent peptidase